MKRFIEQLLPVVGAVILSMVGCGAPQGTNSDAADAAMQSIRPEAIRADMRFLSDDLLEGRGTGSRGYDIAAKFMASQFEEIGLQGGGDNGSYFQSVRLRSIQADQARSDIKLLRGDKKIGPLINQRDFLLFGDAGRADSSAEASIVYVGGGVTAPEAGYDDYKGIDVKGKIAMLTLQAPPTFESSVRAHYSSFEVKEANAASHGAIGLIWVDDPVLEKLYPFDKWVRDSASPNFRWLDEKDQPNDYYPQLKAQAFFSLEGASKLFEGSGHTADDVFAAAKAGKESSFSLPLTAKIHVVTNLKELRGANVAAILSGSDPTLAREYVVLTAHLDHLGIGEPVKGDKIYNGALDNSSGSASLIEIARAFGQMNPRPRRSVLFLAVTGEEAGDLGSDYFAHYPTVPKSALVADINLDEDLMLWPLKDMVVYGAEHSSMGKVMNETAKRLNLTISPDPAPEEVDFIRSDQYSFVKQGIPAVFPVAGFKSDDPKINPQAIFKNWEQTRYHQPQDDMEQPGLDFTAAASYVRFVFLSTWITAEKSERPSWNHGDFFGERYANNSP